MPGPTRCASGWTPDRRRFAAAEQAAEQARRDAQPGPRRRRGRAAGRRPRGRHGALAAAPVGKKVPATVTRGDRSLGKSRTAVSGAMAASADQPRRALIWINRA